MLNTDGTWKRNPNLTGVVPTKKFKLNASALSRVVKTVGRLEVKGPRQPRLRKVSPKLARMVAQSLGKTGRDAGALAAAMRQRTSASLVPLAAAAAVTLGLLYISRKKRR